ncbi:MAG: pyruvate kinase, partial [Christensenellaceae bacterium]
MRKTKIICTQGPAVDSDEMARKLILAGMDCARFNFSHGTHAEHK